MKSIFFFFLFFAQGVFAQVIEVADKPVVTPTQEAVASAPVAAPALTESDIPLHLEGEKKATSSEGLIGKVLFSLIILSVLGGGLFLFIRKYSIPRNSVAPTAIKVLSQHHFGPKKSLALVRVAGESILIGLTDQNINLIKTMALLDDDVPEETPRDFNKALDKASGKSSDVESGTLRQDEEFAISGIKDIVQKKLQSMRNFQ